LLQKNKSSQEKLGVHAIRQGKGVPGKKGQVGAGEQEKWPALLLHPQALKHE
jgi:hypothetical protein